MTSYSYSNSFHGTGAKSIYSPAQFSAAEYAANDFPERRTAEQDRIIAAAKRIRSKLCGIAGCTCGDWMGRRS